MMEQLTNRTIIYYHKACSDGFAAAVVYYSWLIDHARRYPKLARSGVIFKALDHDKIFEELDILATQNEITTIYFLDLSIHMKEYLKMKVLQQMEKKIYVIDHHKTTNDELKNELYRANDTENILIDKNNIVYYDTTRSGASLTWRVLYNQPPPLLVQYVEDRDLWRFTLPFSRDVNTGMNALLSMDYEHADSQKNKYTLIPYNGDSRVPYLEAWYIEMNNSAILPADTWIDQFKNIGRIINRMNDRHIATLISLSGYYNIDDKTVRVCNSALMVSDLGDQLYRKYPCDYCLVWRYDSTNNIVYVSLRSAPDKADCSVIAKQFANQSDSSGGGHEHSAGFRCSLQYLCNILKNPLSPMNI
jgi:uncharacterized protein